MKNLNNCIELGMIINATYKTVILLHEILGLPEYPDYIKNLIFSPDNIFNSYFPDVFKFQSKIITSLSVFLLH